MRSRIIAGAVNVYGTYAVNQGVFRITMKMKDPVNEEVLKLTLATTIKRYPYFKVRELCENGEIFQEENDEPIPVIHTKESITPQMLTLSWWDDCISVNIPPGLTDESGIYQFIKSFLYYYSSKYYSCTFSSCRIRFTGEQIPESEWEDPLEKINGQAVADFIPNNGKNAYNLPEGLDNTGKSSLYCIRVPEREYLEFAEAVGCSPDIAAALLLARAVSAAKSSDKDTVIALSADMREALDAQNAHQPLQCFVTLSIPKELENRSLKEQAAAVEESIRKQKSPEAVREQAGHIRVFTDRLLGEETIEDKYRYASDLIDTIGSLFTVSVSYRGMADYDDAEQFVKAFYIEASPLFLPLHLSLCDMNGYFFFNIFQYFEGETYVNALAEELESAGLNFEVILG